MELLQKEQEFYFGECWKFENLRFNRIAGNTNI